MSADPCNSGTDPVITMDLTNYASNMACQEVDIKSPNYPGIYGSTLPSNCEWTITVTNPGGMYTLGVDFIDFESETADSLEVEFVTGGVPTQAFIGNSADFMTSYPDPRTKLIAAEAASVVIRFTSAAGSTTATGFHLEVLIARSDICNDFTGPSSFVLSAAYPIAVYATRNFPNVDTSNEECVSDVTSPADSAVYVHYADVEQQSLEDFLYIYDTSDPAAIKLLRLLSPRRKTSSPADFDSRTTSIQVVWANNPTVHQKGVMIKFSYTVAVDTVVCNDNGVISATCDCPTTLVNPTASCAVATADGFVDINALTADTTCNPDNANAHELFLSYTEAGSYQLAATGGYYAPGVYDDNAECHWLFTAPTGSELYLIIRDFDVDGDRDRFQFLQRGSNGRIFRFTGDESATNIPYSSGGAMMNFDVINALILGADDRMKVEFVPMTTDGTVGRGVLFEVRVIDPACPTPCVNGGVCVKTCVCNQGYQGAECDEGM
ncbi:hypothetical protein BSL78_22794 [Apostichopus japonicus]|uniref:CUB domain-containing protein n=1 Tax=Stichopus japonicus TaxID=307972 RepID=A0A2G8JX63_STIJA|nr:hypothetical protein BSL78_22794 [Apostichopus japonicus]